MIEFKNVSLTYGTEDRKKSLVLNSFDLKIESGEFACLLGPSGCGKSTLLNLAAGFIEPTDGSITFSKKNLTRGYVFQNHNIFPWKTVRQNIAVGLRKNINKHESRLRIEKIASDVGLHDYLDSYPSSLSGGMKQRVGIARALIGRPDVMLMDEPFSALDAITAGTMRKLLINLQSDYGITTVFVTHNIDEAIQLGTRIIVVRDKPARIALDINIADEEPIELRDKIHTALGADSIDEVV